MKNWSLLQKKQGAHEASLRNEILQKGAAVSLRFVPIVDKVTECTIWEFFRQVYDTIDEKDTIYFDITHGFRSLPLAVLSILHYARELKSIEIGKVYTATLRPELWRLIAIPMLPR